MQYPSLIPTAIEKIKLPSGMFVEIPKAEPVFELWKGAPIPVRATYGGKPTLNVDGEVAFAEIAILRICEKDGWQGVWVDAYRKKYRTKSFPINEVKLPLEQEKLLLKIYESAGSNKGCWDVFCWMSQESYLFAESKWKAHDKIRPTQPRWLEAAIKCGLPLSSFLIVECSLLK